MFYKAAGLISAVVIMSTAGAMAQSSSTSNSTSGAAANSGSSSAAISRGGAATGNNLNSNLSAGVTVDQRSYGTPNGSYTGTGVNYTGGTNNYSTERQTGDVTVRTTPTVYAPPVSGGNPCTLAYSGGVSVIGWGAAAGATVVDEDCATRQKIAMIHNAGYAAAAKELMCNDRKTYDAFKSTGQACAFRQAFEAPGAPPTMVQQPVPPTVVTPAARPAPMAAREYPRCNPARGITDNCRS